LAAQLATCNAVTDGTIAKQACFWCYWITVLKEIGLAFDPFLTDFSRSEQHRLIATFGAAVRASTVQEYSGAQSAAPPISSTIHATFDTVAHAYRAHDQPSLIHENDGKLAYVLQWSLRGYANKDPSEKPQKVITP
jgi:hypothetical protein